MKTSQVIDELPNSETKFIPTKLEKWVSYLETAILVGIMLSFLFLALHLEGAGMCFMTTFGIYPTTCFICTIIFSGAWLATNGS